MDPFIRGGLLSVSGYISGLILSRFGRREEAYDDTEEFIYA